jgi:fermentation-respiration switch protein FrsA (DUF1100 family)
MLPTPVAAPHSTEKTMSRVRTQPLVIAASALAAAYLAALLLDSDVAVGLALARAGIVTAMGAATVWLTVAFGADARIRAGAGLLAVLLGSTALAAGAAAGISNLVLAGLTFGGLAGTAAAIAGATLLAIGGWWSLRPLRGAWRLIGLPAAIVVAQFWLLPVLAGVLSTHAPQPRFDAPVPAGAERVAFTAEDGTSLVGWFTPSRNGATVIVLPGAGGTKADTQAQVAVLTRNDFGVLAMDHRGSGESGGHPMLYGWGGDRDLVAAVTYLVSRADVDPNRIAALGLSMGGEVAISGAAADPRIKAVVAEGAEARTCADQTFLPDGLDGAIHHFDSCLGWQIAGLMTGAAEPAPLVEEIRTLGTRPALLIAADDPEEHAAIASLQAVSPATVELWQPSGAGHTGALAKYPQDWEARVIGFLTSALLR